MLEKLMKMYVMYMAYDVRSPMPHMFGPPGCGKSWVVEQLAQMLGVNLHILNVSRISPLELEGVQMPVAHGNGMKLDLLHATFWTQLKEGDILLLDEFLRGFPEVYNGMLDIFTSRQVGGYQLPNVFIVGASNSTVSYDKALEDRLLHLPVPDPRTRKAEKKKLATILVEQLGLLPMMVDSMEMQSLLDSEVLPMFEILDNLKSKTSAGSSLKGSSLRNLIGQAQLREVQSPALSELIKMNNHRAAQDGKWQYVLLLDGKASNLPAYGGTKYDTAATRLQGNPRLTEIQAKNLELNLQLVEMETIRNQKEGTDDDDVFIGDPD